MGFFNRLETLQSAPLHKRKLVAGVVVAIGMLLVFGIWSIQLRQQFAYRSDDAPSAPSPFSIIMDSINVWER